MNREYGPGQMNDILRFSREVGEALNVVADVNRLANFRITQTWILSICAGS
jgi:hypothetical protein